MFNQNQIPADGVARALNELLAQGTKSLEEAAHQTSETVEVIAKGIEESQAEGRQVMESFVLYVTRRNETLAKLVESLLPHFSITNGNGRSDSSKLIDDLTKQDAGLVREMSEQLLAIQEIQVNKLKELVEPTFKMLDSYQKLAQSAMKYNDSMLQAYQNATNELMNWFTKISQPGHMEKTRDKSKTQP